MRLLNPTTKANDNESFAYMSIFNWQLGVCPYLVKCHERNLWLRTRIFAIMVTEHLELKVAARQKKLMKTENENSAVGNFSSNC